MSQLLERELQLEREFIPEHEVHGVVTTPPRWAQALMALGVLLAVLIAGFVVANLFIP